MPDTLTIITTFIHSPPGQLAAGATLGGIVWKFFERVEAVLNDDTKLEIAVWLLGMKVGQKMEQWPETFAKVFDRVFGERALSWRCFYRSCELSLDVVVLILIFFVLSGKTDFKVVSASALGLFGFTVGLNLIPDYLGLLATRVLISQLRNPLSFTFTVRGVLMRNVSIRDFTATLLAWDFSFRLFVVEKLLNFWAVSMKFGIEALRTLLRSHPLVVTVLVPVFENYYKLTAQTHFALVRYPLLITSIWLWLYVGSGYLLKFARRFDIGFQWFNRKLDIEKQPLQSIGLVAGALVAVIYWTAAIVSRFAG